MRGRVASLAGPVAVLVFLFLSVSCGGSDAPEAEGAGAGLGIAPDDRIRPEQLFGEAKDPDLVVARVGDQNITAGKVYEVAALNMAELLASGQTLDEGQERNLRQAVLGMIIDDELMTQKAESVGVMIEPAEIDAQFQAIQDRHGTAEAFERTLADEGLSADEFRAELERRLLKQVYIDELTADITVTEDEARAFYDANPDMFREGETAEVLQILIRSSPRDPEARRADADARIAEAHGRAAAGEDFEALAREYSEAPNAATGGLVTEFPRGEMVPKFEEQSFSLPIGSISEVFQIPQGLTFIKVLKRNEPTPIPFAEIKPNLMIRLVESKRAERVKGEMETLRVDGDVEILDVDFLDAAPDEDDAGEGA